MILTINSMILTINTMILTDEIALVGQKHWRGVSVNESEYSHWRIRGL